MNFQQLEYVIALDQVKHFGEAAEKCHVTQATLSAMIIKLEDELGYRLFDRSKQPVMTTDRGRLFIDLARNILTNKQAMLDLNGEGVELSGTLRLGIIPTIATSVLPLWLPKVSQEFPKLKLEIREITTEEITRALLRDELDIGLLSTPLGDELLQEHILYYEPMVVYGHQADKKQFVSTTDLQTGKLWLLEEGHCFREQVMTLCELQSSTKMKENIQFKASSFDTLIGLAEGTKGMTLLPELYTHSLSAKRKKSLTSFTAPYPVREISLVNHRLHAHEHSIKKIGESLQKCILPKLSTSKLPKADLQIIGF